MHDLGACRLPAVLRFHLQMRRQDRASNSLIMPQEIPTISRLRCPIIDKPQKDITGYLSLPSHRYRFMLIGSEW